MVERGLRRGDRLAERFVIRASARAMPFGELFLAKDERGTQPASVYVVSEDYAAAWDDGLLSDLVIAAGLVHKNLAQNLGSGNETGARFVAAEHFEGRRVDTILRKRREREKEVPLKELFHVVAHVCNGLQFGRSKLEHGVLSGSSLVVTDNGRVKIGHFGLRRLRGTLRANRKKMGRWERAYFPPMNRAVGRSADAYSLGILIGQMRTLHPLDRGVEALDEFDDDALEPELRTLIVSLLTGVDDADILGPSDVKRELLVAVNSIKGRRKRREAEAKAEAKATGGPPPIPHEALMEDTLSVRPVPTEGMEALLETQKPAALPVVSKAPRWLLERNGVDYGPFTSPEMIEKLFADEVEGNTPIYDLEEDIRLPMAEFELFEAKVLEAIHEKVRREEEAARLAVIARRKRQARWIVGTVLSIGIAIGVGSWGWSRYQASLPKPERPDLRGLVTPLMGMLPTIAVPDSVAASAVKEPRRSKKRSKRERDRDYDRRMRYEERLARNSSIDATVDGAGPFKRRSFDAAISKRSKQLFRCLTSEIKRSPALSQVEVTLTVLPRGDVINVKVPLTSSGCQRCVRRALRGVRVDPFAGTNINITLPYRFR